MGAVDLTFAGAFIDNQDNLEWSGTRIFGVRLRKFCLWHRLLLRTIDSPFTRKGAVTLRDLRTAIGVCRLKYGDSRVVKPKLGPFLMVCGLTAGGLLRRWKKPADPKEPNPLQKTLARRVDAFLEYCGDYLQQPEYTIITPDTKSPHPQTPRGRAPEELQHASELISWSGWSEATVWNLPLGKANWYRAMAHKEKGYDVDFLTPEEKAFQATLPQSFKRNG